MESSQITRVLQENNHLYQEVAKGNFQVQLEHDHARYTLHITVDEGWLHYGAELIEFAPQTDDVLRSKMYEFSLELNRKINGAHIAANDNMIVLIRNDFLSDINDENLLRGIEYTHAIHEYVYPKLLYKAKDLNIRLVSP